MRGYIPPADDDERLFVRRLGDLVQAVRQRGTSRSTPFLSDRQQELARAALVRERLSPAATRRPNGGVCAVSVNLGRRSRCPPYVCLRRPCGLTEHSLTGIIWAH